MLTWLLVGRALAADPEPGAAPSEEAPPWALRYAGFFGARINPLGLGLNGTLALRRSLAPPEAGVLRQATFAELSMNVNTAPNQLTAGPMVKVKPLAILESSAGVELTRHLGIIGAAMPFDSVDANWSDPANRVRNQNDEEIAVSGVRVTLATTLQAAVGPLAVRNTVTAVNWTIRDQAVGFYDANNDLLQPNGGWVLTNNADILYLTGPWVFGARHTWADAAYGTGGTGDQSTQRVGPIIAYQGIDRGFAKEKVQHLATFALIQWHVVHPWRAGTTSSVAYPMVAVALAWDGELWRKSR